MQLSNYTIINLDFTYLSIFYTYPFMITIKGQKFCLQISAKIRYFWDRLLNKLELPWLEPHRLKKI